MYYVVFYAYAQLPGVNWTRMDSSIPNIPLHKAQYGDCTITHLIPSYEIISSVSKPSKVNISTLSTTSAWCVCTIAVVIPWYGITQPAVSISILSTTSAWCVCTIAVVIPWYGITQPAVSISILSTTSARCLYHSSVNALIQNNPACSEHLNPLHGVCWWKAISLDFPPSTLTIQSSVSSVAILCSSDIPPPPPLPSPSHSPSPLSSSGWDSWVVRRRRPWGRRMTFDLPLPASRALSSFLVRL